FVCFFLFQAEDGIRDDLVTGVQTCALPILYGPRHCTAARALWQGENDGKLPETALAGAPELGAGPAPTLSSRDEHPEKGGCEGKIGRASCRERVGRSGCGGVIQEKGGEDSE